MNSRVFLVTGATAGIGLAIARGCARVPQSEVILVGRNEAKCRESRDAIVAETSNRSVCALHVPSSPRLFMLNIIVSAYEVVD